MTENAASGSGNGGAAKPTGANSTTTTTAAGSDPATAAASSEAGFPFYDRQRQHLKALINSRRELERKLAAQENLILVRETEYLENTPAGNIVVGFDNYTKGGGAGAGVGANAAAAAQRRKTAGLGGGGAAGSADANVRVFSRSSVSYNPLAADAQTPASTPASHAPTPVSSSFGNARDGTSRAPTPTSTAGGTGRAGNTKKNKKSGGAAAAAAAAAAAGAEDSETDGRETKKVRTSFGAARK